MQDPEEHIKTGILELYVLGLTTEEQSRDIHTLSLNYPAVWTEIEKIESSLMKAGSMPQREANPASKAFLLATIDYLERIKGGEAITHPLSLHQGSRIDDYKDWLVRNDMQLPEDADDLFAKIIGYTKQLVTAVVWIKHEAQNEVHDAEHEKFLILEGTCDITVGNTVHSLKPGDFMQIPLHESHNVKVTSAFPCKVILQRAAA